MKLTDVCDFQGGSQPPKDEWSVEKQDGYIRMLQIRDFTQSERVTPEYIKISNSTKICEEDDILIARYGASLGKILTGLAGAYNVAIMRTIPDTSKIKKRYLYYYLKSDYFQNAILNVGSRAAQAGFNKDDLAKLEISCPSLAKQEEIINVLYKIESIIEKRKQEIIHLDKLIKARFVELFGDPERNIFSWEEQPLSEHLTVIGGYAFKSEQFFEEGIPVLRIGNINAGFFRPINLVYWKEDDALSRYKMYPGDLVMSLTGTVGKDDYGNVCILGTDYDVYYLNQRNAKLELQDTINKYYLSMLLKFESVKKKLTGISRGVRQANISNKDILNLSVPIPPIELQNEFAAFVVQVDKSKVVKQNPQSERRISLWKSIFRS